MLMLMIMLKAYIDVLLNASAVGNTEIPDSETAK